MFLLGAYMFGRVCEWIASRGFEPHIEAIPVRVSGSINHFTDGDVRLLVGLMRQWPTSVAEAGS